jgi:non-heme chloroperoxidase
MYRYRFKGFGEADKPWDGYNYDTMVDDFKAILDSLDLQDATLSRFS